MIKVPLIEADLPIEVNFPESDNLVSRPGFRHVKASEKFIKIRTTFAESVNYNMVPKEPGIQM